MKKILNNKIYRFILCIFVIATLYFLPSIFIIILKLIGLKSETLSSSISLMLYLIILVLIYLSELKSEFKIFRANINNSFDNGFKYWILGLIVMVFSNVILNFMVFKGNIAANEELNRQAILTNPIWYTIISTGVLAPLIEEIIFRKSIDKIFNSKYSYYVISGLLFGFAHTLADLSSVLNLLYIIPYGALGFTFAIMDKKTNTIFTSIMMHSIHNLLTLGILFTIL